MYTYAGIEKDFFMEDVTHVSSVIMDIGDAKQANLTYGVR
jgi:hypothetical protein